MNNTDLGTLAIIVGLALVTVLTRSFFFISSKSWQLPHWAQRGLQYAPIAALSAVVVPEIVTVQGVFVTTWQDARLFAAVAGAGCAAAYRGDNARRPPNWWCGVLGGEAILTVRSGL